MSDEGKITISYINENPGLVVRGDTAEEVDQLIASVLPVYKKFKDAIDKGKQARIQNQNTPPPGGDTNPPLCGIHGNQMVWKTWVSQKTGKLYAFWSCPTRNSDGSYCQYKPQGGTR